MISKKTKRTERFIQFGEGGFLRGFADWMIQKLNEKTDFEGSVVIVQPIPTGTCAQLEAQNCNYTHVIRGKEGVETCVIDSVSRCVNPYEDYAAFLALATQPELKYILSNTTEAGIVFDPSCRREDAPATSFPGKVTALLYQRFLAKGEGFVFLPCELIDRNGDTLRQTVLQYADLWNLGESFREWVQKENVFCNTLVDRINTGFPVGEDLGLPYEDNLVNTSEFFHLWVIETPLDLERELPFRRAGLNVIVTQDALERYRTRKVRILNGAHTSLVCHALLSGFDTVKSCMDDGKMRKYLETCIFDEILPTLDLPKEELEEYARDVLTRFENPYIRHYLSSISLNSVSKFRVRVLPSVLEYKKRFGRYPKTLVFALARLIEFYKRSTPKDLEETVAFIKEKSVAEILARESFWGCDLSDLLEEVEHGADQPS